MQSKNITPAKQAVLHPPPTVTLCSVTIATYLYYLHFDITYVKLKKQISLLGGNFIICSKCQVVYLRALSQVHTLSPKHK